MEVFMSYIGEITNGRLFRYAGATPAKYRVTTKATKIGKDVFYNKKSLEEVACHDALTEIGEGAFQRCENLKKVNFNQELKVIGTAAFEGCSQLSALELPDSLEVIGPNAFDGTKWLDEQGVPAYSGGFLLRVDKDITSFEIEPGTKGIAGGVFSGCDSLTSITIPDGVRFINENAFSGVDYPRLKGCESLTEITIPDSMEQIGKDAFTDCDALQKVTISAETVKRLGSKMIEDAFFFIPELHYDNKEVFLKSLPLRYLFGEKMELGGLQEALKTFLRKKNIRKTLIEQLILCKEPDALNRLLGVQKKLSIEEINGYYALAEERNIALCKAVLLEYRNKYYSQADVSDAEQEKVEKDLGLKELSVADWRKIFKFSVKDGKAVISGNNGTDEDVIIPEKIGANVVAGITEGAFKKDSKIKTVVIKAGIKVIPREAFYKSWISKIELPPILTKIDSCSFQNCRLLEVLVLPPKTKEISYSAFAGCVRLKTVELSKGLKIIQNGAFRECEELESVTFAKGLKTIGDHAFDHCVTLKTLQFPDTLEEIGVGAFSYCKALTEVYLGVNTVKIGDFAFNHCEALTIHAPAGSYAEQYAKEHNIPFVAE